MSLPSLKFLPLPLRRTWAYSVRPSVNPRALILRTREGLPPWGLTLTENFVTSGLIEAKIEGFVASRASSSDRRCVVAPRRGAGPTARRLPAGSAVGVPKARLSWLKLTTPFGVKPVAVTVMVSSSW